MSVLPAAGVVSFARGVPSPDMLPARELAECARGAVERQGRAALNYGPPLGYGPLREWIAARHGVPAGRVVVTPGSLVALNFLVRCTDGRAIVEAPTYDRMLHTLADVGAEVVAVQRDDDGLDLAALAAAATPPTRFLYVLPTFHNPTGRTLTGGQREALAELATARGLPVYEDDPYGELRIDGTAERHLRTALPPELALFTSSFSKTVAPGLRVGYAILPPQLVAPVEALATRTYVSPPLLAQAQVLEFLGAGHLEPHLRFVAGFLRERRDALLGVLEERLSGVATWTRPGGGYFLWLELPVDAGALLGPARAAGVDFVPGAAFGGPPGSARLSYSFPSVAEVRDGAHRLADVVLAHV